MDVMTAPAKCCSPDDSLERAAELMWDYELSAMPIVDGLGRPTGWLSDRAICMTALRSKCGLAKLCVKHARMPSPPLVHRDVPLCRLEREMVRQGSDWLAVVDDEGRVVGVVTSGDVDRALRSVGKRAVGALKWGFA